MIYTNVKNLNINIDDTLKCNIKKIFIHKDYNDDEQHVICNISGNSIKSIKEYVEKYNKEYDSDKA